MRKLTALLFALACASAFAATRVDPLPPEEVFVFSASADGRAVRAEFAMPDEYYLYRDRFIVAVETPGFSVLQTRLPAAKLYDDPFFGETGIYEGAVTLEADIAGAGDFEFKVISQGCDRLLGICYPPQTHVAFLHIAADAPPVAPAANNANIADDSVGADAAADAARILADKNLWAIMAAFFGFGLLLSFTPCVLPMIPILLGVIGGDAKRSRALAATAAYIGGVTVAYTALGIAAGLSGQLLAPYLQHPAALVAASAALLALAASMFGLYEIRIPAIQKTGGGAFMAGALSAAIVSPCVAAPLIGALIYIGNTGDALVGGAALFSLSLGMSALLAVAGIGGAHVLPRAGEWTADIKLILGALLCGAALWVSSSLLPPAMTMALYGGLLIFCGVVLFGGNLRGVRAAGIVILLWGGAMIVGAAGGGRDPLSPLSAFVGGQESRAQHFAPVRSKDELQKALSASARPAMLEFYADWCISCKEMEAWTFSDSRVRARMENMLLLRADVSANNENDRALLEQFGLYGPPAILFFAPGGELIRGARVSGYQSADEFLRTLDAAGA